MVATRSQQTLHASREKALRKVLRTYFRDQAERMADAVQQFGQPTPAIVPMIFRPDDEHERLLQSIERPLILTYCAGAADVLDKIDGKAFNFGFSVFDIPYKLSQAVMTTIRTAVSSLGKLAFWRQVQDDTSKELAKIIGEAVADGDGNARLAKRIKEELSNIRGKMKSDVIGVTESTAGINAGAQIQGEELARDGYIVRKSWLATMDEVTRQTHSDLDGVSVGQFDNFIVGGFSAPYPAHHSLPPQERINCRCGILTEIID